MTYVFDKHDIGILRSDGTTKEGFMLTKDKYGNPNYKVFDDEYLANQFFSGTPGYDNLPPEKELLMRQEDWRAGLGLEVFDSSDPYRYHKSTMDMRFRGKGIAGWKSTAISKTADASSSTFTPLSVSGPDWATVANIIDGNTGTYATQSIGPAGGYTGYVTFTIPSAPVSAFAYYVTESANELASVDIDAYYNAQWNNVYSGAHVEGSWDSKAIGSTETVTSYRIRFNVNASAGGTEVRFAETRYTVEPASAGTVVCKAEFNDNLYFSRGNQLCKLDTDDGNSWTGVQVFPADITDLEIFSDSKLYIALGLSYSYYEMTTAEAFTKNTLANNYMKYFAFVRTTADTMYGSDGVNTIRSTTNPADGGTAWSAQTTIGSTYHQINGLDSYSGALYIPKEDTIYYLDSSGNVQDDLAPELTSMTKSTDNGKNAFVWLGSLYLPWGEQGLLEIGSSNTWRSPALFGTDIAEYNGQVFAIWGDDQYLYAVLDYSTKVEVLAGRLETIDGTTGWVWHCINETTLTGCETAWISTVYQKRLWITSTSSADDIYYIPLPTGYADVVNDSNVSWLTGTTLETPWLHGNFKGTTKAFPSLELMMGHTYNASRYFTVQYKKLGDSAWTTIGNYTGSATSMTESKTIPVDGSGNKPSSAMFKLKFTAVTNSTSITPILLGYNLKGILYPSQRQIIYCQVYCANEITDKQGLIIPADRDNIITVLDEARAATYPFTLYDIDGTSTTVKMLPLPSSMPRWEAISTEKNRKGERAYNLMMQVIT